MHELRPTRVGLALSGGSVRGLAHIGVYKTLTEAGIRPAFVAGTSAGSIIGAAIAAGMGWKELERMARSIFWPKLLHGETLERFCERNLPRHFSDLRLPFAAIATALPHRRAVSLSSGKLASAISASCAMRVIRGSVRRDGHRFKDGGIACALPASACRRMGASFVVSSDVWELSALLRSMGLDVAHPSARRLYPAQYHRALRHTDLLIHPRVPLAGYWPSEAGSQRMIAAGEQAARRALGMDPAILSPAPWAHPRRVQPGTTPEAHWCASRR